MKYKGYVGHAVVDAEAGVIRGQVVNVKDTITFQGKTVEEARAAFEGSVDDYLSFCASLGEPPDKPYSGKFLVRVSPAVQRDLHAVAKLKGVSVNQLVARSLRKMTRGVAPPKAAPAEPPEPGKAAGRETPAKTVGAKGVKPKRTVG